jgi:hypothetical protein
VCMGVSTEISDAHDGAWGGGDGGQVKADHVGFRVHAAERYGG